MLTLTRIVCHLSHLDTAVVTCHFWHNHFVDLVVYLNCSGVCIVKHSRDIVTIYNALKLVLSSNFKKGKIHDFLRAILPVPGQCSGYDIRLQNLRAQYIRTANRFEYEKGITTHPLKNNRH